MGWPSASLTTTTRSAFRCFSMPAAAWSRQAAVAARPSYVGTSAPPRPGDSGEAVRQATARTTIFTDLPPAIHAIVNAPGRSIARRELMRLGYSADRQIVEDCLPSPTVMRARQPSSADHTAPAARESLTPTLPGARPHPEG